MSTLFEITDSASGDHLHEADMLRLLRERYGRDNGNGPRFVYAQHVKSACGFDAARIADFIAVDLWPSSGNAFHGHEVKVSRADWLAELRQPEKAAAFTPYMHRWWLVVSDRSIVADGELPVGWGLMAPKAGVLRVVRPAAEREPELMPRTMQAALLRAAAKTALVPAGGAR